MLYERNQYSSPVMTKNMATRTIIFAFGVLNVTAFNPCSYPLSKACVSASTFGQTRTRALFMSEELSSDEAVAVADEVVAVPNESVETEDKTSDDILKQLETGGKRGKSKRGKRKGGIEDVKERKASATLAPEEIHYEGPPAITETIVPTVSILTVVGIVPAAAAWARQAWVRYKITSRRIRVTSGINGNDMSEIVYPDIVELRTAKRLFGDGDLVAFLRDGARFEVRNIPNFDDAIEFILKQVDEDVAENYRKKGDVTLPEQ